MESSAFHTWMRNARLILTDPIASLSGMVIFVVILYLGYRFGNISMEIGNMGKGYVYTQYIVHLLLASLFGLFIAATLYKIRFFRRIDHTTTTAGSAGGLIGAILIGCPACSISIAGYLGIGTLLTYLPGRGLELKILGLVILLWATYKTIQDLTTCQFSSNKKSLP